MKSLIRCLVAVALVTVCGGAAYAQDIAGAWQGTLRPGTDVRLVFVITNGEQGALKATMHPIDQGGRAVPISAVTLRDTTVSLAIAAAGITFEGKLSADKTSIDGTWSQGGRTLPLTLARATPATAWTIPAPPTAMAADAPMTFAAASIKSSDPNRQGRLYTVRGRQVITINTSLADLIGFAYGIHARQITAGPAWLATDKYDITALPDAPGQPNERQLRALIQSLLTDRFKLTFHREKKDLPVYAIVVGERGHKLTKNDTNPDGLPSLLFRALGVMPGQNATMADFAGVMQRAVLDRPVVDKTALSGRYDFTLTWTPDDSQFASLGARVPPPSGDANAPPGLFTAIQEQMGLKLESTTAPVEVLVIDRVEKPTD